MDGIKVINRNLILLYLNRIINSSIKINTKAMLNQDMTILIKHQQEVDTIRISIISSNKVGIRLILMVKDMLEVILLA